MLPRSSHGTFFLVFFFKAKESHSEEIASLRSELEENRLEIDAVQNNLSAANVQCSALQV